MVEMCLSSHVGMELSRHDLAVNECLFCCTQVSVHDKLVTDNRQFVTSLLH